MWAMSDVDPLVAFVLARIGEDEEMARAAQHDDAVVPGSWTPESYGVEDGRPCYHVAEDRQGHYWTVGVLYEPIAEHVARQSPRATLARCAALRELVGRHERFVEYGEVMCRSCAYPSETTGDLTGGDWPCDVIRGVAAIWSWHPEYQAGWAVDA